MEKALSQFQAGDEKTAAASMKKFITIWPTIEDDVSTTNPSLYASVESETPVIMVKGKEKAYREGKVQFQYKYLLGYKKGTDGKPEIVPEEAEIVRLIYTLFLDGYSMTRIKKILENKGYLTAQGKKFGTNL